MEREREREREKGKEKECEREWVYEKENGRKHWKEVGDGKEEGGRCQMSKVCLLV